MGAALFAAGLEVTANLWYYGPVGQSLADILFPPWSIVSPLSQRGS